MVFHETTLMFGLALSAAVGAFVLFTITRMKVNAAGTKLWAAGFTFLSIANAIGLILPELATIYQSFIFTTALLSGYALILAGAWHYVGYLLPTSKMALLFVPIIIVTFIFTFIVYEPVILLVATGAWLIAARAQFAWILWRQTQSDSYEGKVAKLAAILALIEIVCMFLYIYYGAIEASSTATEPGAPMTVVMWLGALVAIMLGGPVLMLLSTSRFITDLNQAAHVDALTGIFNRRGFYESAKRMMSLRERQNVNVGLLMLDVDWFKKVNDTFGHAVGDVVLEKLGQVLKSEMRETDLAARWGGEEFCILAYDITEEAVENLANRIRLRFTEECGRYKAIEGSKLTLSVGIACSQCAFRDIELLIKQSDDALYEAKHISGKDCVVTYCSGAVKS